MKPVCASLLLLICVLLKPAPAAGDAHLHERTALWNGHAPIGNGNFEEKDAFILREDDDLFVPALWNKREIIAYSKVGYAGKAWQLPDDWRKVKAVDLYRITLDGCVPLKKRVPVSNGRLLLSLEKEEAVSILPAGAKPSAPK